MCTYLIALRLTTQYEVISRQSLRLTTSGTSAKGLGSREQTSSRLTFPDVVFRVGRLNSLRRSRCLALLDSLEDGAHRS